MAPYQVTVEDLQEPNGDFDFIRSKGQALYLIDVDDFGRPLPDDLYPEDGSCYHVSCKRRR